MKKLKRLNKDQKMIAKLESEIYFLKRNMDTVTGKYEAEKIHSTELSKFLSHHIERANKARKEYNDLISQIQVWRNSLREISQFENSPISLQRNIGSLQGAISVVLFHEDKDKPRTLSEYIKKAESEKDSAACDVKQHRNDSISYMMGKGALPT